ncbi:hypothetical protein TRAPUB_196 [Trametes pubescens]|uniref:Uncharacterized protein n=1 Tax=Trametes pubescens TaxID=154538 RepID=A0A1M2VMY9_TRAPU|nr:hypothetical protein TRAPUB_196 [Trametes pubescens]
MCNRRRTDHAHADTALAYATLPTLARRLADSLGYPLPHAFSADPALSRRLQLPDLECLFRPWKLKIHGRNPHPRLLSAL